MDLCWIEWFSIAISSHTLHKGNSLFSWKMMTITMESRILFNWKLYRWFHLYMRLSFKKQLPVFHIISTPSIPFHSNYDARFIEPEWRGIKWNEWKLTPFMAISRECGGIRDVYVWLSVICIVVQFEQWVLLKIEIYKKERLKIGSKRLISLLAVKLVTRGKHYSRFAYHFDTSSSRRWVGTWEICECRSGVTRDDFLFPFSHD